VAERLLFHIRRNEILKAGERVGVAVSGGIDSVALLRLLLELRGELGIVLSVVHFNHKLRGAESDSDQEFVRGMAQEQGLDFLYDSGDVRQHAGDEHMSVEAAARELRYGFFRALLGEGHTHSRVEGEMPISREKREHSGTPATLKFPALNKIVTGHTMDDQAETVLLRIIRGAGLKGIAGIHPEIEVANDEGEFCGQIVRPLLTIRRRDLESYLRDIGQEWREDATNASTKFTRNRVRRLLVPLLEKEFNPSVTENFTELAEIARAEEDYWENEVAGWMGTGVHWSEPTWARKLDLVQIGLAGPGPRTQATLSELEAKIENVPWLVMNASVDRVWLLGEPLAVQRRIIKAVGEEAGIPLEFKHVEEVLRFVTEAEGSGGELSLPLGWKARREQHEIVFVTPDLRESGPAGDYEYELPIPGEVSVPEIGWVIEARRIAPEAGYNPEQLLDGDSLPRALKVRNWRAGDRFWPKHTKAPKKIKELLQERHVRQPDRHLWPVVVSGTEIVWMRGFPPPANFAAKCGREAVAIVERPYGSES
jgi:tRNA(Ile)-lysidine synthase